MYQPMTDTEIRTHLKGTGKLGRALTTRKYRAAFLCDMWNFATAPWLPRTHVQHGLCQRHAKAIADRMRRLGLREGVDYRELSNGSLFTPNR